MLAQLEIESLRVPPGGYERGSKFRKTRPGLAFGPLGPVAGAVARGSFSFEPHGPGPQTLRALEERGLRLGVGLDSGGGPLPGPRVAGPLLGVSDGRLPGNIPLRPEPGEGSAQQRRHGST